MLSGTIVRTGFGTVTMSLSLGASRYSFVPSPFRSTENDESVAISETVLSATFVTGVTGIFLNVVLAVTTSP